MAFLGNQKTALDLGLRAKNGEYRFIKHEKKTNK